MEKAIEECCNNSSVSKVVKDVKLQMLKINNQKKKLNQTNGCDVSRRWDNRQCDEYDSSDDNSINDNKCCISRDNGFSVDHYDIVDNLKESGYNQLDHDTGFKSAKDILSHFEVSSEHPGIFCYCILVVARASKKYHIYSKINM